VRRKPLTALDRLPYYIIAKEKKNNKQRKKILKTNWLNYKCPF
jgi:hypothetical protein